MKRLIQVLFLINSVFFLFKGVYDLMSYFTGDYNKELGDSVFIKEILISSLIGIISLTGFFSIRKLNNQD